MPCALLLYRLASPLLHSPNTSRDDTNRHCFLFFPQFECQNSAWKNSKSSNPHDAKHLTRHSLSIQLSSSSSSHCRKADVSSMASSIDVYTSPSHGCTTTKDDADALYCRKSSACSCSLSRPLSSSTTRHGSCSCPLSIKSVVSSFPPCSLHLHGVVTHRDVKEEEILF